MQEAAVQLSDHDLLSAIAQARDRAAFSELLQRHQSACYNLALRIACREDTAAEAVQEAFLKIWTSAGQYTHETNARGWIMKVVARKSLTLLRSRRKHRAIEQREAMRQQVAAAAAPAADAERSELLRTMRHLLELLPDTERQLVALYYGGELSQDEIARSLNMPQRTVSHRLAQVIETLRAGLTKAGFASLAPVLLHEQVTQALCSGATVPAGLQAGILQVLNCVPLPKHSHRFSRRVRTMRETSMLLYVAGGLMVLGLVVFLATSAHTNSPDAPKGQESQQRVDRTSPHYVAQKPESEQTIASLKFPTRKWSFANGPDADVKVLRGHWEWRPGKDGADGAMHCGGYVMVLLPDEVPARPFAVTIKSSAMEAGQVNFDGFWTDGLTIPTYRLWLAKYAPTLNKSPRDHITFRQVFWQRYVLTYVDRTLCGIREFPSSYPAMRVAVALAIPAVSSLEIQPLEEGALPKECQSLESIRMAMKGPFENPEEALMKSKRPAPYR